MMCVSCDDKLSAINNLSPARQDWPWNREFWKNSINQLKQELMQKNLKVQCYICDKECQDNRNSTCQKSCSIICGSCDQRFYNLGFPSEKKDTCWNTEINKDRINEARKSIMQTSKKNGLCYCCDKVCQDNRKTENDIRDCVIICIDCDKKLCNTINDGSVKPDEADTFWT